MTSANAVAAETLTDRAQRVLRDAIMLLSHAEPSPLSFQEWKARRDDFLVKASVLCCDIADADNPTA